MKQILKLIFLLVIGQTAFAQAPSNYTNINGRYRWIAGMFDSTFHIPKGSTPSLRTGGSTNSGGLFYNTSDSSVYTYTGTQWIKLRGSINPSDTTNKYVTQVYKKSGSDSIFYVKGGNHLFAFVDSVGSPGGGGGGKVYYFNGGVSMGTFGGFTMYELGDTANTGAAANFTRSTTGNIANFITDPNKPGLLQIPAGVWSVDAWLSETGGGANHAEIWVEVEKWDGSTITTIATSPIEQITEGATPNLYSWSVSIPTTSLTVTDRIIIQFYISNTNGKTVTLYTQNGYVGEVHTTFTTGIGAINGLTAPAQYLVTGTSGTDFNINSSTATHTFNLPTASATNRGALSTTDWSSFNNKIGPSDTASMLSPYFRLAEVGLKNTGQTVYADTLLLSTRAWRQKGVDSVASLINTSISGTTNYIPKFTSSSAIGNSAIYDNGGNIGINNTSSTYPLAIGVGGSATGVLRAGTSFVSIDAGYQSAGVYGTAAAPSLIIGGDDNTGIWHPASDVLAFSTAGSERMRLDASGNLGIGVTTPSALLEIQTSSTTGNADIAYFGRATFGAAVKIARRSGSGEVGSPLNLYLTADYNNNQTAANSNIIFETDATEKMRITSGGNVGIGTTSPSRLLTISATNPQILLKSTTTTGFSELYFGDSAADLGTLGYAHNGDYMYFNVNSSERMRITSGGEVLINTTSDAGDYKLQVNGNGYFSNSGTAGADLSLNQTGTGGRNYIIASTGSSFGSAGNLAFIDQTAVATRMLLNSSGELLINTTSDAGDYKLQVAGNIYGSNTDMTYLAQATSTSGSARVKTLNSADNVEMNFVSYGNATGATLLSNSTNKMSAIYSSGDALMAIGTYGNTNLIFGSNNTERFRLTNTGDLLINTTSDAGDYRLQVQGSTYLNGLTKITNSLELEHTTKSANYTLSSNDYTVGFDCAANRTANLPDATTCAGRIYVIYQYNTSSGTYGVTLDGNGSQTINGNTTYSLAGWCDYTSIMIQSDGSNWIILSDAIQGGCL